MRTSDACCQKRSDAIVQCSENGKIFRLNNPSRKDVLQCVVDGCLIHGGGRRCDYLFVVEDKELYLVELKGTSHVHALRQIIESAENLGIASFAGVKRSAIVGSPSPKTSSVYQSELVKLAKRFKACGLHYPIKKNFELEIKI